MCHFWDDVWNLVGLQTTARCTAWAVSLGSSGRCFFTAVGAADVVETGEEALVDPLVVVVTLGWPEDALETRLSAPVIEGCEESLRLEEVSRVEAPDDAEEGCLPEDKDLLSLLCVKH